MKKGLKLGQIDDLREQAFGGLLVLDRDPVLRYADAANGHRQKRTHWHCRCVFCGKVLLVPASNLKRNKSGCKGCSGRRNFKLGSDKLRIHAEPGVGAMYTGYRRSAERRRLEFSITYEYFTEVISKNCAYCGAKPRPRLVYGKPVANGIDRKDNRLGYTEDNCLPCCTDCNYEKNDLTESMVYKFFPHLKPQSILSDVMLWL